jgi:hypothetical protein
MTTSQPTRRTGTGSPVRRALSRSLRALRGMHSEQMYTWERFYRIGPPPEPRAQAPAAAGGGHATASPDSPVPADADRGDRAA